MIPWPVLAAVVIAFGLGDSTQNPPLALEVVQRNVLIWLLALAGFAVGTFLMGWLIARAMRNGLSRRGRRVAVWAEQAAEVLGLALFGWAIIGLDWARIVKGNLLGRDLVLVGELLIIAPFLLESLVLWIATFSIERQVALTGRRIRLPRYLWRRARQLLGVLVPLLLVNGLGQDLANWFLKDGQEDPTIQFAILSVIALVLLIAAPVFMRLAFPTRRLEPGPLRDRLERLARRLRFRSRAILVWETDGQIVNAAITGVLPCFRYVLLTDALIDRLDPAEIEAVFGHEIGHVKHSHIASFGIFFVGSMGLLSLIGLGVQNGLEHLPAGMRLVLDSTTGEWVVAVVQLALVLGYFGFMFGYLSRWSERQADVFGCLAVSCNRPDCPPHYDPNLPGEDPRAPHEICAGGIRIFAQALKDVALCGGISIEQWSWRHGSLHQRIRFLERLEEHPETLRRFERRTHHLRIGLAVVLGAATLLSLWFYSQQDGTF